MTTLGTRRLAFLTLANFAFFVGVTAFFSLPVHLQQLGASRAEIGRIMGVFGLASLFGIPLTGVLVDRYGRRAFMLGGALAWSAIALAFSRVEAMSALPYALRFVHGGAFSLCFVAVNALVVELAPPGALGRAIAMFGTTTLAAHAIGPALGEWVAHRYGFPTLFVAAGVMGLLAVGGFAAAGDRSTATPAAGEDVSMWRLAVRPGGRGVLAGALAAALAFGSAIHFVPVFVRARGLDSHAPFFISYVISAVVVRLLGGGLGDRVGHRRVGIVAALMFSVAVMGLSLVQGTVLLVVLALCYGVAHGWAYPAMNAEFVAAAPERARGRAMALYNLSFNVGMTLSAFAAGEIAERASFTTMWLVMGGAASLGAVAMWLDRPRVAAAHPQRGVG